MKFLIVFIFLGASLAEIKRSITLDIDNVTNWVLKSPMKREGDIVGLIYKAYGNTIIEKVTENGNIIWKSSETEEEINEIYRYQNDEHDLLSIRMVSSPRENVELCYIKREDKWISIDIREYYVKLLSLQVKSPMEKVLDIAKDDDVAFSKYFAVTEPKFVKYKPINGYFCTMIVDDNAVIWRSDMGNTLVKANLFPNNSELYLDITISNFQTETMIYYTRLHGKWIKIDEKLYRRMTKAPSRYREKEISTFLLPTARDKLINLDVVRDMYQGKADTKFIYDLALPSTVFYPLENTFITQVSDNGTCVWKQKNNERCLKVISISMRIIPHLIYIRTKNIDDDEISYFYCKRRNVWYSIDIDTFRQIRLNELEGWPKYVVLDVSSLDPSSVMLAQNQGRAKPIDPNLYYLMIYDTTPQINELKDSDKDKDDEEETGEQGPKSEGARKGDNDNGDKEDEEDGEEDKPSEDKGKQSHDNDLKYEMIKTGNKTEFYTRANYLVNKIVDGKETIWESGIENSICHFLELISDKLLHVVIEDANSVTNKYFVKEDNGWEETSDPIEFLQVGSNHATDLFEYPNGIYEPKINTKMVSASNENDTENQPKLKQDKILVNDEDDRPEATNNYEYPEAM
ncbi:signal peptide-containing protein [Theileria equi strain WA]|uniref:Signal peptide-containing protein n=1 Tax=Theileria equi strain WA TaxID=1537102 RepID=L0AYS9_THEEQ|nr:signal peptide-containing protein [Theileria equi strain WA]AFZ80725.1 signal peptide-containing protein [Theileria equi strain WA]|eukprot:XP_004830391.1 signal peptide-containing protein [Theileria equi strain WA]